jgi:hypothetical protein
LPESKRDFHRWQRLNIDLPEPRKSDRILQRGLGKFFPLPGPLSRKSGEANLEPPVRLYNRAAADLAGELPELTQNRAPPAAITVQNRQTGETY